MTMGVGGSSVEKELAAITSWRENAVPISTSERQGRVAQAQKLMRDQGIDALYLDATTSLTYFTGARFYQSERTIGAVIPQSGEIEFISPAFEKEKLLESLGGPAVIHCWDEDENPFALLADMLTRLAGAKAIIAMDEKAPFFLVDGLRQAGEDFQFVSAVLVAGACRQIKSDAEIALMQLAKDISLEVHKAAARILRPGISTREVQDFIDKAHKAYGADGGSTFCIVLFGEPTAYPHGVSYPQTLQEGDMVLIDTGCSMHGYQSDITRSYVFGVPSKRQREIWDLEKRAQLAAFQAAQLGGACGDVDKAARDVIEAAGLGPGYKVPGLPHRTGHGIGMDIHEGPYLVKGDQTSLQPGMCFSNEPMICLYGEFGVRLEDHFYMGPDGPKWFTQPSHSIDDPFGLAT